MLDRKKIATSYNWKTKTSKWFGHSATILQRSLPPPPPPQKNPSREDLESDELGNVLHGWKRLPSVRHTALPHQRRTRRKNGKVNRRNGRSRRCIGRTFGRQRRKSHAGLVSETWISAERMVSAHVDENDAGCSETQSAFWSHWNCDGSERSPFNMMNRIESNWRYKNDCYRSTWTWKGWIDFWLHQATGYCADLDRNTVNYWRTLRGRWLPSFAAASSPSLNVHSSPEPDVTNDSGRHSICRSFSDCHSTNCFQIKPNAKIHFKWFDSMEILGWKLSPVVFYRQLSLPNTTWLSFQRCYRVGN